MKRAERWVSATAVVACVGLGASTASALVERAGSWPENEPVVSIDVSGTSRSEALKKLADAAGWSLMVSNPPDGTVDLHLKGQAPGKVLELLLADGEFIATREGTLVSIARKPASGAMGLGGLTPPTPASPPVVPVAPEPPIPPVPPAPPVPPGARGDDRFVAGGELTIEAGETVHDVAVFGGELEVFGLVTGDIQVMGGQVVIHEGGRVLGDASVLGGEIQLESGARLEGSVEVIGGAVERDDGAIVGGKIVEGPSEPEDDGEEEQVESSFLVDAGESATQSAMLFVFGSLLLTLATDRLRKMAAELAARPGRSFGLGVLGLLGASVLLVALCVTVVGIPFAMVGVMVAMLGMGAGATAGLLTFGHAIMRHRSDNPYAHLAVGALALFFARLLPFVGDVLAPALVVVGFGAFVATRAAGYWPAKKGVPAVPGA